MRLYPNVAMPLRMNTLRPEVCLLALRTLPNPAMRQLALDVTGHDRVAYQICRRDRVTARRHDLPRLMSGEIFV